MVENILNLVLNEKNSFDGFNDHKFIFGLKFTKELNLNESL
jgi:hypothetical protein